MKSKKNDNLFNINIGLFNKLGLKPALGRYFVAWLFTLSCASSFGQVYPTFLISETGGTINVASYGAYPDDGIDDEDEIQAAIDAAGNNTVVVFAAGTYNFSAPDDPARAITLTGTEAHIRVSGKTNITLRGAVDGTTGEPTTIFDRNLLYYTNQPISSSYERVSILDARNNNGVKIENVAFKNKLHYTVGKVLSINSTTITVEIVDGYPVESGCPVASANVWTWDEVNEGEEILKIGEPSVTYGENDGHFFTVVDAQARTMQCVKTGNAFYGKASVGDYVSWHYGWNARGTVYLSNNSNIHLENVHIYSSLRSALFISYNHNLYFNELEIRPENNRFAMSPRDGVHASRNTGEFVSENMYIKGARLDGYVITGTAAAVYSLSDSRNFEYLTDQSVGSFSSTNEPIYFYNNNVRSKVEVQSVSYVSSLSTGSIYSVVTSEDIPAFVNTSTKLVPGGLSLDTVIVRNSTFKSIGGASELYFCDNVLSSNNYHENIMYSPVRLGANPTRNHTGGNLKFSGNEYKDCAWEGNYYKNSQYGYISAFNISTAFSNMYVTNLLIENNVFTSTTSLTSRAPIELDETGNVIISNNTYNGFSEQVKLWDVYNVTNDGGITYNTYRLRNLAYSNFLRGYDPTQTNASGDHANVTHEGLNTASPDQQSWEFSSVSGQPGYYFIKNIDSNKALRSYDVNNTPTSGDDVPVTVYPVTAWGSMMWKPVPVSGDLNTYFLKSFSGNYFLKGASLNTSYATMETDSTSAGTKWILYDITGPLPDSTTSTSFIISPSADAYVKGGTDASINYGTAATLAIKESSNANYDRMSFLKFDLTEISGSVSIAKIRLKVSADDPGASHNLYSVASDSWTESGITWNNMPATSGFISNQLVPSASGWVEFDVTSLVNNETDRTLSVRISDANTTEDYVLYHSKEVTILEDRPQLEYILDTSSSRPLNSKVLDTEITHDIEKGVFILYPNPASDQITIVGSGLYGSIVELTDLLGKSILRKRLTEDSSSVLNLDAVQKGIYLFRLTNSEGVIIIRKIILE